MVKKLQRRDMQPRNLQSRKTKKQVKSFEQQEAAAVKALPKGKATPGSGCVRAASKKSDVSGELFRAECKTVDNPDAKSFRVIRADLAKITTEAMDNRQRPVYVFGWPGADREDWAAFQLKDAETMMKSIAALLRGDVGEAKSLAERLAI